MRKFGFFAFFPVQSALFRKMANFQFWKSTKKLSNLSIFKNRIFCVFPGPNHIKNFLTKKVDFLWKVPFFGIFSRFSRPNCVLNSFWSQNVLLFSLRVKKKFAKMYFRWSPKGDKKFLKFCKILDFLRFSQSKPHFKFFLSKNIFVQIHDNCV